MELKKTVKRIAALGAAGIMLGTTVLSAMAAASLNNYPTPFIKDGKFDGLIVVGKNAAAQDVIGAVDIGTSLQYGMKTTTSTSCGGNVVTIDNGVKITGTGSEVLNYGELLGDVRTTALDDEDLPQLLAEGRYKESKGNSDNDVTYAQKIELDDGMFTYDQPDDNLNADNYLIFDDGALSYTYTLEMDDVVEYDETSAATIDDDFIGSQIEIQGQLFTITDTKWDSIDTVDEMTLMAGDTLGWLMQDQPVKKTVSGVDHEIMVVDVNDAEDRCGVSVDGNMVWIDVNSKETINGVEIAVLDAVAVHAQLQDVDVCELNLGATEIKLVDGDQMVRDGKDISDAQVTFLGAGAGEWEGFTVEFTPDDNVYLMKDQSFVDPAFSQFKFSMAGAMPEEFESIKAERSGSSKATVSFMNNDGKEVELPMFNDDAAGITYWGKSLTKPMMIEADTFDCGASVEDCDGVMLYAITSGETAHVLEITDVDETADTVDLKDITYGKTWADKDYTAAIDLGSLGEITLTMTEATGVITATALQDGALTTAQTGYGADFEILVANGLLMATGIADDTLTDVFQITEADIDDADFLAQDIIVEGTFDATTDERIEFDTNDAAITWHTTYSGSDWVDKIYDESSTQIASTEHGTHVEQDDDDQKYVDIMYPKEEVYGNVFLAPVSAVVSYTGGDVETTTLEKLNIGAAVLDTEVSDVTNNNMIVVGGPCINKVAATIMGKADYACGAESGIPENKGLIKLFEQTTGKVAMLVAGWEAMDTRRAARVVAKYADFALTGTEVVVTGTSLTDIKVEAAQ